MLFRWLCDTLPWSQVHLEQPNLNLTHMALKKVNTFLYFRFFHLFFLTFQTIKKVYPKKCLPLKI